MFIYDSIIIVCLKTLMNSTIIASTTTAANTVNIVIAKMKTNTQIILPFLYFFNSSVLFIK